MHELEMCGHAAIHRLVVVPWCCAGWCRWCDAVRSHMCWVAVSGKVADAPEGVAERVAERPERVAERVRREARNSAERGNSP